ncbi:hypothetical protein GCM10027258_92940 [Amycolatopsis stemonae]
MTQHGPQDQIALGRFGQLQTSLATTMSPTIAAHVRAYAEPEVLESLGERPMIAKFRARLTAELDRWGIVLDGEDLRSADRVGLKHWHGSIDNARRDAGYAVDHATTHFFGDLRDEFHRRGLQGVHERFETWPEFRAAADGRLSRDTATTS